MLPQQQALLAAASSWVAEVPAARSEQPQAPQLVVAVQQALPAQQPQQEQQPGLLRPAAAGPAADAAGQPTAPSSAPAATADQPQPTPTPQSASRAAAAAPVRTTNMQPARPG